jgi:hypothetical protein
LKIPWPWILSLVLIVVTAVVMVAGTCSLWFLVFGRFPAPMFWLIILVYVSVTRPLWEAVLLTYLLSICLTPFTIVPFNALLIYCLMLLVLTVMIRERVYWGGPTYFMLMVGAASIASPVLFWLLSRWSERNPLVFPEIFDWLISACLTALFSLPVYQLFQWYDRIAAQDSLSEGRVGPR